ncbi:hypothetical protein FRB99_003504 [Tulasnella sp. 403]|nr:hypothetical protein FRB99_003504 [Tulasnella sp. 403]
MEVPVSPRVRYSSQRRALHLGGTALIALSFQTLGIIYSDIGTSPLYVLNGIWSPSGPVPSEEDIIGGVSAIIWSLTLVPLLKYVLITLQFGTTEGEGGTFALFHGLFPPEEHDDDDDRALTGDSAMLRAQSSRSSAEKLAPVRWFLLPWTLFGTSLAIADGILTPAVSVTSAVGGLAIAKPNVIHDIVPISILSFSIFVYPMLVLAYLGQGARLIADGESIMDNIFYSTIPGPRGGGLYWIVYVVALLASTYLPPSSPQARLINLSSHSSDRISGHDHCLLQLGKVSPAYCGYHNLRIRLRQIQQLVNLRSLPALRMIYTSETVQGQVYFPVVNYSLAIGTIIMVAAFENLSNLTNAYGFAVSTVMFITTSLVALQTYYTKHLPWFLALGFFLIFGFFDGLFWGASLRKVPHGAWVPLTIGFVLMLFMVFWTWGKGLEDHFDGLNRRNLRNFIVLDGSDEARDKKIRQRLASINPASRESATLTYVPGDTIKSSGDDDKDDDEVVINAAQPILYLVPEDEKDPRRQLARLPTCAVFHKLTAGRGVPHTFYGFLRQWPALPRVVIFLSVKTMNINRMPPEERYTVSRVRTIQGFYGVTYALGFRDDFNMDVQEIIEKICLLESRVGANDEATASQTIKEIRAAAQQATHIVPHYHVVSTPVRYLGFLNAPTSWIRELLIEGLYRRIATMFPETENWLGSADEIIRVGINAEI